MKKIEKIIIGTHNQGKFREIADLLPNSIKKISPKFVLSFISSLIHIPFSVITARYLLSKEKLFFTSK